MAGARLAETVRSDDHVSRHGGGEFGCLLPEVNCEVDALVDSADQAMLRAKSSRLGLGLASHGGADRGLLC